MTDSVRLKITEIFYSLQGEANTVGFPTVFVRLTGCPLRCGYCDTEYAFHGGQWQQLEDILATVASYNAKHVCVTGGEPLAQKPCLTLLAALADAGHSVSIETSGAMDISQVDPRVVRVMDIKTPGSKEVVRNLWSNLDHLQPTDQVKFVLCDREDYDWAKDILQTKQLVGKAQLLFSPSYEQLAPQSLAQWILDDQLPVRFQFQLHKLLWGEAQGK